MSTQVTERSRFQADGGGRDLARLGELEREAARALRRRRVWWAVGIVSLIPAAFLVMVAAAYAGAFDHLDREALRGGLFVDKRSSDRVRRTARADASADFAKAAAAPPAVTAAIQGWVNTVNRMNGDAVTLIRVDGFGNAYITFTAVYDTLPQAQQMQVLDKLGNYYRSFLGQLIGTVPTAGPFVPGLLVIDTLGLQATNRDGRVEWCRPWNTPVINADGSVPCRAGRMAPSGNNLPQ